MTGGMGAPIASRCFRRSRPLIPLNRRSRTKQPCRSVARLKKVLGGRERLDPEPHRRQEISEGTDEVIRRRPRPRPAACRPCSPLGVGPEGKPRSPGTRRLPDQGRVGARDMGRAISGPCPRSVAAECSSQSSSMSRSISRCPRCRGPSCSSPRTRPEHQIRARAASETVALSAQARDPGCALFQPRLEVKERLAPARSAEHCGRPVVNWRSRTPYDLAPSSEDPH